MKTKVLLAICAVLMTGTGFAQLTAEPNILNSDFEIPVLATGVNSDSEVVDWVEAEDAGNTYSRVNTRRWGPGNWPKSGGSGINFAQLIANQTAMYWGVSTFLPNTPYDIEAFLGKRNDQAGSKGRVELWAGGTLVDTDDGMGGDYDDATFQLALAGATLVDSAEWDFSGMENWQQLWSPQFFTLATGTSHTTSDPLYLLFVKTGGGQLAVDEVYMSISPNTFQVAPDNGAVDVPLAANLEWVGPGTYENEKFDVYLGTTEPNFLLPAPYELGTTVVTDTTATSAPAPGLDYETTYYWVVDTYEPNTAGLDYLYHPATTYSSFTTIPADVPPVVAFVQNGFRTWLQGPAVSVSATVTDLETIDSIDWEFTTVPASYSYGDPNTFLTDNTIDNTAPTAEININTADPNTAGFYVVTLSATDAIDAPPGEALTGSAEVWFTVHNDGCEAFIANGNAYRAYDANDDCVIDLTDAAAWFALWLEDRTATDPIIYLN